MFLGKEIVIEGLMLEIRDSTVNFSGLKIYFLLQCCKIPLFLKGRCAVSQESTVFQVLPWLPWQFASKQPPKYVTTGKEMVSF